MSEIAIEKLKSIISTLKNNANYIDKGNLIDKSHKILEDNRLFSTNLFKTNSDKFLPYVLEAEKGLCELQFCLQHEQKDLSQLILETLEQQLNALHNATSANNVMHNEATIRQEKLAKIKYKNLAKKMFLSSQQLHQKLSEYHVFERRLLQMLEQKELELTNQAHNKQLTNDALIIHQRLGRCRKAISKVERDIEVAEKTNLK